VTTCAGSGGGVRGDYRGGRDRQPVCEVKDWMASLPRGVNTPSSMRTTKDLMPRWHVDTGSERGW